MSGVRVVKAFAAEERQLERFRGSVARVFDQSMITTRLRAFYNPFIGFLPNLGLAVVLLVGGRQVVNGSLTLGDFTAFYAYLLMLIAPMRQLGIALGLAQRATASGARIFELLDREPRLVGAAGRAAAAARRRPRRARRPCRSSTRRRLRRRCGTSTSSSRPARRSRWSAPPGRARRRWCSCSGGSTTSRAGSVRIDGADVRSVDVRSLRDAIAVVDDDPFLFSASVHDNIAYARPDATREEVERAAERAQAAGFIEALPSGYDTRVGERGLTLSGGQRQRIAIARALLADPRILVLDDATSSVDASTEQAIKQALREVMAGRTTFVIAHRLSTIALADEIVVLEDGRVAARGTHAELLERSALYARDRREGPARPGVPQPQAARGGGRAVTRAGRDRPPLARHRRPRAQAARPARAAAALPRPRAAHVRGAAGRHRRGARPAAARQARDRRGHRARRPDDADLGRRRLPGQRARLLGRHLRADLPRRLGRPARAAGPADPALRAPADAVDRLLLAPPGGRADLAPDQRRAGARPARVRRRGDAVRLDADAGRHGGDPARARRRARAADLPRLPGARARLARVPDRLRQRLPRDAREGRRHHRLPAGDAVGHPRRAHLRAGAAPSRALRRAQRRELRREHEDRLPERGVLPGGRAPVGLRDRGDPALRRRRRRSTAT